MAVSDASMGEETEAVETRTPAPAWHLGPALPHGELWERVSRELQLACPSSIGELSASMMTYVDNKAGFGGDLSGLLRALELRGDDSEVGGKEAEAEFWETTLPWCRSQVLRLPALLEEFGGNLPSLAEDGEISMDRETVAAVLCAMFLGVLRQPRDPTYPHHASFATLFNLTSSCSRGKMYAAAKLRCFIDYFAQLAQRGGAGPGSVTYIRRMVPSRDVPRWDESGVKLSSFVLHNSGSIEDAEGALQVDFANKYLGGGAMSHGAVQEEIMFAKMPELVGGLLLCPVMGDGEAVAIVGAKSYSKTVGYASSLEYAGRTSRSTASSVPRAIVAIDALHVRKTHVNQSSGRSQLRELRKAYVGFNIEHAVCTREAYPDVATGNWGCGVFGGFVPLKACLQWIAASQAGRGIQYYAFDNPLAGQELAEFTAVLRGAGVTVGQLYQALEAAPAVSRASGVEWYDDVLRVLHANIGDSVPGSLSPSKTGSRASRAVTFKEADTPTAAGGAGAGVAPTRHRTGADVTPQRRAPSNRLLDVMATRTQPSDLCELKGVERALTGLKMRDSVFIKCCEEVTVSVNSKVAQVTVDRCSECCIRVPKGCVGTIEVMNSDRIRVELGGPDGCGISRLVRLEHCRGCSVVVRPPSLERYSEVEPGWVVDVDGKPSPSRSLWEVITFDTADCFVALLQDDAVEPGVAALEHTIKEPGLAVTETTEGADIAGMGEAAGPRTLGQTIYHDGQAGRFVTEPRRYVDMTEE